MPASSFCASSPRDATRRMSATELVCAAPSQQRLRRSSVARSQQHYNLALNSSRPSSRCCWQHLEEGRGGTSRGDARCAQHQLRRSSISSVAAAARRRQCPATIGHPLEWTAPRIVFRRPRTYKLSFIRVTHRLIHSSHPGCHCMHFHDTMRHRCCPSTSTSLRLSRRRSRLI